MKTRILLLALFMSAFSWGQILTFDFDGYAGSEATGTSNFNNPNLTTSTISRGAGLTAAGNLDRFNATAWALTNIANAVSGNDYMEFTITPNSGFQFSVSSIFVQLQRSATGPSAIALRSSLDGYTANLDMVYAIVDNTSTQSFTFTFAQPNSPSPVTYRMYMYAEATGGSGGPGDGIGNDIVVNGTVTSTVPMAPVITSDLNASGFVGVPFSYTIVADNSPTSYNATGLPPGFSINTTTGVISGTPGATGTFFITISATNGIGFDEQTLILTITDPGPEINIRGASGGTNNIINGNTIPNAFNNTLYASIAVGANQDKDFRIENLGISNLTLSGVPRVQITGTHAADFTVTTQPAASIVSGANSVFVIRFSPLGGGVRNAMVSIINNDSDENPYTFAIQGGGLAPDINIVGNGNQVLSGSTTPDLNNHTNFGNVNEAGTISKLRNFFIINLGGEVLNITNVTISGTHAADFAVTVAPSATVGLNNSTTLGITFDPSALGLREALVTITNNVPGKSPYTFAISGVGIDFDECIIGGSSVIRTQQFTSTGATAWGYSSATALGGNPPVVTNGTAFGTSRTVASDKFIATNSLQIAGPYPSTFDPKAKVIVTFDTVDTSAYQEVLLEMFIGAYSTNGSQGLDVSDWLTVFVSGDDGATWSREVIVKGNSNAIWSVASGGTTFTNPFKGLDIPYEVQPTANSVGNGTRRLLLTNLPQVTQLRVKIEFDIDRNDEVWVVDNVFLRGRLPVPKTWTGVWSGDGNPPTSVERAIFAANYNTSLNGNVTACECLVNTTRTVTITDGNYIQSAGRIVNNGTLNIQNNGSLIQLDDYAVNTGSINLTRTANIRRLDYVYWSSPVASFPVLNISTGTPASNVFKWLPTIAGNFGNWTTANENMVLGKGYIVRGPSTFNTTIQPFNATFTGVPNNGMITPTIERGSYTDVTGYPSPTNPAITVTANDDNFNLLGNPYPSAIRALDFLTENTNIEGSVRIWTHGLLPTVAPNDPFYNNFVYNYSPNDYIVHNGTGTVSGPLGFNGFIASGQGFFVLMNDGPATTETVTFKNSMRNVTHANNQFFRQSNQIQGEEDFKIWLDFIPQNGNPVRTLVGYVDGATNEKDRLFDASTKVDGSSKMYSLIDDKPYIIQGRALPFDKNDSVPMGYNTTTAGTFTVAIADVIGIGNKRVYLEDKLLNSIHDLTASPYVFNSNAGVVNDRFELRFTNQILSNPDFTTIASSVIAFGSNGELHVKSSLEKIRGVVVYDVLGRTLLSQKGQGSNEFTANTALSNQTVIVQIELENGQIVTKKIVL